MTVHYVAVDGKDVWKGNRKVLPPNAEYGVWTVSMLGGIDIIHVETEQEAKNIAIQEIEDIMRDYQKQLDQLRGEGNEHSN